MIPPIIFINHQNLNKIFKNLSYLEKRWLIRLLFHYNKIEEGLNCLKEEDVLGLEEKIYWIISKKNQKLLDFVLEKTPPTKIEEILKIENSVEVEWIWEVLRKRKKEKAS